ncbi:TonB-dependent receptor [Fulvivirgaceae bacterium BMA10]|uniref:TonB-dependent receptor n=1 Tax=Splendidivirga corallicola TaxID=3051826 RepID=A0ABT8KLK1_9BACT|nr:TonB-dependent receptor [Fulvivirgaceae bacterium BMA10]
MLKILYSLIMLLLISIVTTRGQSPNQTIRGHVLDQQSQSAIPGATVLLLNSDPIKGTSTDMNGDFRLENIPVGRQSIQISFIGYVPVTLNNIMVHAGKEVVLKIELLEEVQNLDAIEIKASKIKDEALNELTTVSARSFSLEEATRFAGTFNDPARMAQNYAGVASSGDIRNDIVIRGNSPSGLQYRLEGIPIPNPNHFGTFGSSGGGISMLSQNILSSSDFLTGAFPAEFGEAISGVFDIYMRNGNNEKQEFATQIGFRGIEFAAEGPFSKSSKSSYLFNYRYSTLAVFDALGFSFASGVNAVPQYQDLAFKLNFAVGTKNNTISVFGLGGNANIHLKDSEQENVEDFFSIDRPADLKNETATGVVGVSFNHFFNKKAYGKLTLAVSRNTNTYRIDTLNAPDYQTLSRADFGEFNEDRYKLAYNFNQKFSAKNTLNSGLQIDYIVGDSWNKENQNGTHILTTNFDGNTYLVCAYSQWQHRFNNTLTLNTGLHAQHLTLTSKTVVEPRLGLKWQLNPDQSFSAAFGLHSQSIPVYAYFIEEELPNGEILQKNRDLDFLKSQHYIIAYDNKLNENLRLKIEAYYQRLYNIPVERSSSSYSVLNEGADFAIYPSDKDVLVNEGSGRNLGLEITLERFFNRDYYFLMTTSLFDSKYKGSDDIDRNTAFNGNYIVNVLAGKEFKINNKNTFSIDFKTTFAGGKRFTPIDVAQSQLLLKTVLQEDRAYEDQFKPYVRPDVKFSYAINRGNVTHQISLDIQNFINRNNEFERVYSIKEDVTRTVFQQGFLPELQYRILF